MKILLIIIILVFGGLSSISNAKPIYLACNYNAYIMCSKNILCGRPENSKQIENTSTFNSNYNEYVYSGISYYVIYKEKLFSAKYFSKEDKKLKSIADDFVDGSGGKYTDDSTYEYIDISMKDTKSNYKENYYINRINGEYSSYVSSEYVEGRFHSTKKTGQCTQIKYSRKF